MIAISRYYKTSPKCTLLMDDNPKNIDNVGKQGFGAVLVSLDHQGIDGAEIDEALKDLKACGAAVAPEVEAAEEIAYI